MSKKSDPEAPSGRITFDARGNAVWEWRTQNGDFKSDVDTQTVRALQEDTNMQLGVAPTPMPDGQTVTHDPYSTAEAPQAPEKRRTLDDMRKLSEEIKRARNLKKSP
jgi:hypothetical protein